MKHAFNVSNHAEAFGPDITALLARDPGNGSALLPVFNNLTPDHLALLDRTAELPTARLEADRRRLIATNTDAMGYDIFNSVSRALVEGVQAVPGFTNTIRGAQPENTSLPWFRRVMTWDKADIMVDAENMNSIDSAGDKDKPQVSQDSMSLPFQVVHAGGVDASTMAQARAAGLPIDTRFAREAGKSIARLWENNALGDGTGSRYFGGLSNYGIYDDPNKVTGTLTAAWTGATAVQILKDVADMKADMVTLGYPEDGPYALTVPSAYSAVLDYPNSTTGDSSITIRQAILNIMGMDAAIATSYAPSAKVALTYMGSIEVVNQLDVTAVPYSGFGNSEWAAQNWVFFAALNVRHLVDYNGNFGVVVYSAP